MKVRYGPDGMHLFWRNSGLNMLFDEVRVSEDAWSIAPRQVSIALTNLCDLSCSYCYAPKHRAALTAEQVAAWLEELDNAGCLGVGFGGGEPTLHPKFAEICENATVKTSLAVTFTTHGHRLVPRLLEQLTGNVNFIRVSVDGVTISYEAQRGRSFASLVEKLKGARKIAPLGINVVVNEKTVGELSEIAALAEDIGATEILLLPQQATSNADAADSGVRAGLARWVGSYAGEIRLAVSEAGSGDLPICEPFPQETLLRAYAHVNASGYLKPNSFHRTGAQIESDGVLAALSRLKVAMEKSL